MKSPLHIINIILALLVVLIVFGLGYKTGRTYDIAVDENDDYLAISYSVNEQKMRRLMSLIDNHYIEDIDTDSLVDKTISYVMSNLDPHSMYLEKELSRTMDQDIKGFYVGIGIQYVLYRDSIVITHVDKNSPNKNLFKLSDRIIQVNDSIVIGKAAEGASKLIQGEQDTQVKIKLLREGEAIVVNAVRAVIPKNSVMPPQMLTHNLGYIKINRFGENTYTEFKLALHKLQEQGMGRLVLDLRGNPGGIMKSAEQIVDEFLPKNKLIVFTQDKQGKKTYKYATSKGDFDNQPIYILIDEGSASASEIIAGAIQDNDAGTIIGRRSYGKGLVQREISLGDGSKLRLTTAKYFTPTGRSIQKPYMAGTEKYNRDISDRYISGEMFFKDSIKIPDSLMFKTPKGKVVYGGGGIIPDEFISIDSLGYGRWYYEHAHKNAFNTKIFDYIEKHHQKFQKIQEKHFIAYYNSEELAEELLGQINLSSNQFNDLEMDNFQTYIKATIANFLYGESAYNKIWSQRDPMIRRAIELNEVDQ